MQEFSKKAIKKKVIEETAKAPETVFPGTVVGIGVMSAAFFGLSMITGSILGVGILAYGLGWAYKYFIGRSDLEKKYLEQIREKIHEASREKLNQLKVGLKDLNGDRISEQLNLLQTKFSSFNDVLKQRFDKGEMTYLRYQGIAEQVYLSALDNIEDIYIALKAVSTIDEARIRKDIELNQSEGNMGKVEALKARLDLLEEQKARIEKLSTDNEKALTEIDKVSVKLALTRTQKGNADTDLDQAMDELARMADKVDLYQIKH
ncbi:hypothetical protein [Pleionea sediminis]|uniref:hypothetical protein n=1 Tax=Pleionea sediminis TaxID=2569479 RepID=UPI0011870B92|nr:hypothetical protein [Pleionea sediminis]